MDLTVGIAVYEDLDGLYFTLQSLHAHHPRVKYLVIDNAPAGCSRSKGVTEAVGGRYLHRPDLHGTSRPRDALFRLADTPWVLCLDSHVLLEPGALQALLDYIREHPESKDLLQGPLVHDNGTGISTHWRQTTPPGLWGTWDVDPRHAGQEPFEIPMQGLGLFAMRCSAWPGFHPSFRGFGGEEGYIHEKTRQHGGKVLCLPRLRWRHRFRHMEHGAPPPPYRLAKEDHVWNLLVGHRELGIDATEAIRKDFAQGLAPGMFEQLLSQAEKTQAQGQLAQRPRLRLLGVWYTNNAAPEKLLQASLRTIKDAVEQTMFHDVSVATSAWAAIANNPFPCTLGKPQASGHAAILEQIDRCLGHAGTVPFGVVFLEHDVLYPPGHFDRMGNALVLGAPVVSNLDYIGLNETGWLNVKERHEPMHQLAMRWSTTQANLYRCENDVREGKPVLLEPQGDRTDWVRLPPEGLTPAVHVNHPHRFTNHGEVVFEATAGGNLVHPFWGAYQSWWPLEAKPMATGRCGSCGQQRPGQAPVQPGPPLPPVHASIEAWFAAAKEQPSDFQEHMETLRGLAAQSETVVELSTWLKPALLSLAAGRPKKLVSVCPGPKPEWEQMRQLLQPDTQFVSVLKPVLEAEPLASDLLFLDTRHQAEQVYQELALWGTHCRHWIVLHTTATFGERGDDGGPGVLPGMRRWLRENRHWFVLKHVNDNHGLTILSCQETDKKPLPSGLTMAWNYAKALARHKLGGSKTLGEEEVQARLDVCLTCDQRVDDRCSVCGCYLAESPNGDEGKAVWAEQDCPLGRWPLPVR